MKPNCLILTVAAISCILLFKIGCRQATEVAPEPQTVSTEPQIGLTEPKPSIGPIEVNTVPEVKKKGPRIEFENVVHDFGKVGPGSTHRCEFKFINTGDSLLKVKKPTSTCGCTVAKLSKKEYAPGESGSVKITRFHVPTSPGTARKDVFVSSNDPTRSKVRLTVQAKVVLKVTYKPKRLKLLLNKENAGCPEITLTSLDGQPFAIKSFSVTGRAITADYDSSLKAKSHVIQPKINTERLKKRSRGQISIKLTHPGCDAVTIPFTVVPRFEVKPPSISIYNAMPQKPTRKTVKLFNNYGEDFEIESVSSEKGLINVLSQERVGKGYKFVLEITPPADADKKRFTDVFHINIKGGEKLRVKCTGFYAKK